MYIYIYNIIYSDRQPIYIVIVYILYTIIVIVYILYTIYSDRQPMCNNKCVYIYIYTYIHYILQDAWISYLTLCLWLWYQRWLLPLFVLPYSLAARQGSIRYQRGISLDRTNSVCVLLILLVTNSKFSFIPILYIIRLGTIWFVFVRMDVPSPV